VFVNYLKAVREEVKEKDFSHKFLRCLPSNQVLGDVMTDDIDRDDDEKKEKKEKKDEKKRVWHSKPHHHQRERPSKIH
jgi:hypothetical protein